MKKVKVIMGVVALATTTLVASCSGGYGVESISQDLRFCESVLSYKGGMLIANFGSSELNPLNSEGKGYINYYEDGKMTRLIPADGSLSAPKGLLVCGDKLFIADVGRVVVYDLSNLAVAPTVVTFPEGEPYVNHLVKVGGSIFVTVTNSGNIYSMDLDSESLPIASTLKLYANVPGANGLLLDGSTLYIASYPADGVTTDANVIYRITDMKTPQLERVTNRPGQYDGLAKVGDDLYFTDWQGGGLLGRLDLKSGKIELLNEDLPITGSAEIDIVGGKVAVPDLVNSVVYLFEI